MSRYDVNAIRSQVQKKLKKERDPTEFRPPKVDDDETKIFRFYVLPPFNEADGLIGGKAERGMDLFWVEEGAHYIENKRFGCPRIIEETECPICQFGFDCIRDIKATNNSDDKKKEEIRKISSNLLSSPYRKLNIYFPEGALGKCNPEDLHGKVRWYNSPTTVFNMMKDCLDRDDDGGDELNPEAFGVFFDEENAYLFELRIYKKGRGNSYERSGFIVTDKVGAHPIARLKGGKPDLDKIGHILDHRHNLFDKLPDINMDELKKITRNLSGDSEPSDNNGFDSDETSKSKTDSKKSESSKGIKPNVKKESGKDDLTLDEDDLTLDDGNAAGADISGETPAIEDDDDAVDALLSQLTDD